MRVEFLQEADRPTLCRMLEESDDFPAELLYLYRRRGDRDRNLVAWRDDEIHGVLSGSLVSDLAGSPAFESFELPPAPHAFLDSVHVRGAARGQGVRRALVKTYAEEAEARGCSFIGGLIDLSSDSRARTTFFVGLGSQFGRRTASGPSH